MKYNAPKKTVFIVPILWLWLFAANLHADSLPEECGAAQRLLFYKATRSVDSLIRPGFSDDFFDALNAPLKEIGYCPVFYDSVFYRDTLYQETPLLYISLQYEKLSAHPFSLVVSLLSPRDLLPNQVVTNPDRPLISLIFDPSEISTFETVAVRKTIENLRTQFVCHLRLQSDPAGVSIKTNVGLEGVTPLEWVIPVGELKIQGTLKDHAPFSRTLDLHDPGIHTYLIEMRKRQFYNSKFMYPTVAFGVSAVVLFTCERYYYSKYHNLGREEYFSNPEKFETLFNTAKKFEYIAASALVLTGASFSLCFVF